MISSTGGHLTPSALFAQWRADRDVSQPAAKDKPKSIMVVVEGRLFRDGIHRVLERSDRAMVGDFASLDQLGAAFKTLPPPDLLVVGIGAADHARETFMEIRRLRLLMPAAKWIILSRRADLHFLREAVETGVDGLLPEDSPGEVLRLLTELVLLGYSFVPTKLARILSKGGPEPEGVALGHPRQTPTPRVVAVDGSVIPSDAESVDATRTAWDILGSTVIASPVIGSPAIGSPALDPTAINSPCRRVEEADERRPDRGEPAGDPLRRQPGNLSDREIEILRCLVTGHSNKMIARELHIAEATVKVHVKGLLRKMQVANRTQAAVSAINFLNAASGSGYHSPPDITALHAAAGRIPGPLATAPADERAHAAD